MKNDYEKQVKNALEEFLRHDFKRILLINGKWGVGKTYFIRNFLTSFFKSDKANQKLKYIYVSLFGISSLDELKKKIINSSGGLEKHGHIISSAFNGISDKLMVDTSFITDWVTESTISNKLICFDDIERKNSNFKLEEFFGYIDFLKNQKNCRSIVIINNNELNDDECKVLAKYRDKIADMEVAFEPPLKRNFSIIFTNGEKQQEDEAVIFEVFEQLACSNMRTMQRVKWGIVALENILFKNSGSSRSKLVRQFTILTIFHYEYSAVLSRTYLEKANWISCMMERNKEKRNPNKDKPEEEGIQKQANQLIIDSRFSQHDLDPIFFTYLYNGFLDEDNFKIIFEKWSKNSARQDIDVRIDELRNTVWGSFSITQEAAIAATTSFLNGNLQELKAEEYIQSMNWIEQIQPNFPRVSFDEKYILARLKMTSFNELPLLEKLHVSNEIKNKIHEAREVITKQEPLVEIIRRICSGNSWNHEDYKFINAYTLEELRDYLTDNASLNSVRELIILCERLHGSEQYLYDVADKLETLTNELSERSALDKVRTAAAKQHIKRFRASTMPMQQESDSNAIC